ncbi:MAG: hypothetical protein LBV74_18500 [Tannerella sp.]|jgi:hypothetical protein|nr:hypothetical protein [Tannerella sp.]
MKKASIMFVLLLTAFTVMAQRQTEDNRKGDEAMKSLDYSSAKIWYEVGVVSNCDPYSISQLTKIWLATDESMRLTMRGVMGKCLSCLDERATQYKDTTSMKMLILYYTEGIGTYENETKAEIWTSQLDAVRNPYPVQGKNRMKLPREKVKMQFFVGYSATYEAPVGLTFGGVGRTLGWYLRFRTNMSFQDYSVTCDEDGSVIDGGFGNDLSKPLSPDPPDKVNMWTATGGFVIKASPSFYVSVGAGYCNREALYKIERISLDDGASKGVFWAKRNGKTTFSGVALDLDGTLRFGKMFYGSLGCSVFDFSYRSANAGIGVFF